ncbi:GntP family permease [Saccharopolyspora sp. HNM0983]|uniref:GntP family permease n=1 Tax=Saccharopolyspora montiporae TaxID=2781240 RepID=A0A929B8L5_9PSEU|nr:gluconate:H+ symporter [Saccharopolyspora sp. HNM0983]MBE9375269.1 GntP family permease [Saccharopolyspora sp. HNM0983]
MPGFVDWLQQDTAGLLTLSATGIAVLLLLIIRLRVEPFIALIVVGMLIALTAGIPVEELVGNAQDSGDSLLESGIGSTLGHIAAIVGLGSVLGSLLEASGGAQLLTRRLLRAFGERRAPLAMGLSGLVFGIPVFFDIGVFVLAPLVYVAARQSGRSILLYCLPLAAGLSVTHAFLPPHPGPVVAAGLLGVDLGWLILLGAVCALPAFAIAGVLFPAWIGKRIHLPVPDDMLATDEQDTDAGRPEPALGTVAFVIGLPMVLILGATFTSIALPETSPVRTALTFLGNPVVALTLAVLCASWLLGFRRGMSAQEVSSLTGASLKPLGMILLVVGAGGFFGEVLEATGVGDALAGSLQAVGLPMLVSAYVISAGLRIAQGSATVAIVTTGGIVAPLLAGADLSQPQLALIAIAIASGSIIASHVNDGGFWIISRYFGIPVAETLKTWTVLETLLSVVGFATAALLSALIG